MSSLAKPETEPRFTQFVVTVVNNSPHEVGVYISPADRIVGDELAEDETIAAGDGRQFMAGSKSAIYLRARAIERHGQCMEVQRRPAGRYLCPGWRRSEMANDVGQELCYVFISPSDRFLGR